MGSLALRPRPILWQSGQGSSASRFSRNRRHQGHIVLRIDQFVVAPETPPWVAAQEAGWELEPSEDTAQRHAFNARLTDAISAALARVEVLPYWGDGPGRRDEPSKGLRQ